MNVCIQKVHVKNFRCFSSSTFDFDAPVVIIEGDNGSGKTSLLEALHYTCYLKSFRTHISRDLVAFDAQNFFIGVTHAEHIISIGSTGLKKQVKIDQKVIVSYQELRNYYRAVTITEDDLTLIKGSPEKRRFFFDNAIVLAQSQQSLLYRRYKEVLEQRNAFFLHHKYSQEEHYLWTEKLWNLSCSIQILRKNYLELLKKHFMHYASSEWPLYEIDFLYQTKESVESNFDTFYDCKKELFKKEYIYKRTLFGAHLDEIEITFSGKKARLYASRGQQKLLVLLLKISQISILLEHYTIDKLVFLLDDFMTDFDHDVFNKLMKLLTQLSVQLIFTSPVIQGSERLYCKNNNIPIKVITI